MLHAPPEIYSLACTLWSKVRLDCSRPKPLTAHATNEPASSSPVRATRCFCHVRIASFATRSQASAADRDIQAAGRPTPSFVRRNRPRRRLRSSINDVDVVDSAQHPHTYLIACADDIGHTRAQRASATTGRQTNKSSVFSPLTAHTARTRQHHGGLGRRHVAAAFERAPSPPRAGVRRRARCAGAVLGRCVAPITRAQDFSPPLACACAQAVVRRIGGGRGGPRS